jgi:hypothetical protein
MSPWILDLHKARTLEALAWTSGQPRGTGKVAETSALALPPGNQEEIPE